MMLQKILTKASLALNFLISPLQIVDNTNATKTSLGIVGISFAYFASPEHWIKASSLGMGLFNGHSDLSVSKI